MGGVSDNSGDYEVFYAPRQAAPAAPPQIEYEPVVEQLPAPEYAPATEYVDFASPAQQVEKLERRGWLSSLILLVALTALIIATMSIANLIRRDFGHVEVIPMSISHSETPGTIAATVYRPINATEAAPAPGILLLPGYQDDKGAMAPLATELARRGYVVMAIDQYGHGETEVGMGPGGELAWLTTTDSGMGGIVGYATLAELAYVNPGQMAVVGHSLGAWSAWSLASYFANVTDSTGVAWAPRAVVLAAADELEAQAFETAPAFRNVLLIEPQFNELRRSDAPITSIGPVGETLGDFADGTARGIVVVNTTHRLMAADRTVTGVTIDWLDEALGHFSGWSPYNQLFQITMLLQLAAAVLAFFTIVPLLSLLLNLKFFAAAAGPIEPRPGRVRSGGRWWRGALLACLIALITYPFLVNLGYGIVHLPANVFRLTLANGLMLWFLLLLVVMLLAVIIPWNSAKKRGEPMLWEDLGISDRWDASRFGWGTLGRSFILLVVLLGYLYGLTMLFDHWFGLDFRALWPVFRPFNSQLRLTQFFIYLPFFVLFFVLLHVLVYGRMGSVAATRPGWRGFWSCWWRALIWFAGGLLLLGVLHFVPLFLGMGPGVNWALGSVFGSSVGAMFGGQMLSLLMLLIPLALVLSLLSTIIYRKTGQVFINGILAGVLTTWLVAGASAFI